ncbi:MAG: hypothetical protein K8R46_11165 [Pirellulales bacterium]|nr:hypothetical protein [Pirellulales bacterium]
MPRTDAMLPAVRFKFMPTPSVGLHVGHAWLLFVMQAIGEALEQHGREVELMLVVDEINMICMGRSLEGVREVGEDIVRDMEQLGVPPDRTVWNREAYLGDAQSDPRLKSIVLEKWRPEGKLPVSYLLHNAALDAHLGITHIIRGADLKVHKEVHEECYEKLGVEIPALDYIPFVRRRSGEKIGSHHGAYTIQQVLSHMSVEELFCVLVGRGIRLNGESGPPPDRTTALRRLLGDEPWVNSFDAEDAPGRERFFARFADAPQFEIDPAGAPVRW